MWQRLHDWRNRTPKVGMRRVDTEMRVSFFDRKLKYDKDGVFTDADGEWRGVHGGELAGYMMPALQIQPPLSKGLSLRTIAQLREISEQEGSEDGLVQQEDTLELEIGGGREAVTLDRLTRCLDSDRRIHDPSKLTASRMHDRSYRHGCKTCAALRNVLPSLPTGQHISNTVRYALHDSHTSSVGPSCFPNENVDLSSDLLVPAEGLPSIVIEVPLDADPFEVVVQRLMDGSGALQFYA
ncbi:hypothetical protein BAUCODRAFT_381041 [Baudoinia panamericana UAMH 10762]|uniref:Uncharacterized protein n=1 Tax=Baudoinia panamericana (strain UAMH 10762) TaxID=717646 RepID=M2MPW6_BAUPA|nr:uncharacterized protein BAUCODRAFT_381041 [Baudoinia panamericana UAMH 10762]EMC98811.1 hypothetical protein BAUCODRAFT_381041 [Baudoinia panamericana UAMH 10762]